MGGATVEGLIKGQQFRNEDITVSDPSQAVVDKFAKTGVSVTTDNKLAADTADIVCVVVKPWLVESVLKDIRPELDPKKQILIVIAAGVSSASIKEWLGENCPPLFLVIPNVAIAEMASMTFIVPCGAEAQHHTELVEAIFGEMGNTLITDEQHLIVCFASIQGRKGNYVHEKNVLFRKTCPVSAGIGVCRRFFYLVCDGFRGCSNAKCTGIAASAGKESGSHGCGQAQGDRGRGSGENRQPVSGSRSSSHIAIESAEDPRHLHPAE